MRADALAVSRNGAVAEAAPLPSHIVRDILSALPGLALVGTQIWLVFGVLTWSLGGLLAPGTTGMAIVGAVLIGPTIWVSWQFCVRAIAAERELNAAQDES